MMPAKVITEIVRRIVAKVQPLGIILFGSAARGEMSEDSDLDFLVVMPDGTHRRQTAHAIYRALYGVNQSKDIVVATESDLSVNGNDPGYIYTYALTEGKEMYHA